MSITGPSPDGEYFVDIQQNTIPAKDTWENMSVKELYEVKTQLENKYWDFKRNKPIANALQRSVFEITQLIAYRESSAF